jgi:Arc/MetJ-type ribon-helix-helix transcriptional regulator
MPVSLTRENECYLQSQVESGRFPSVDAAINAAVEQIREQSALKAIVDEAYRQLENGEYTDYDDDSLRARFDELKQRVRSRSEESQTSP